MFSGPPFAALAAGIKAKTDTNVRYRMPASPIVRLARIGVSFERVRRGVKPRPGAISQF